MRKLLTLTLAVAMVLSMASVAFAADYTIGGTLLEENSSNKVIINGSGDDADGKVGYGKSMYLAIGVTAYDAAKDLKVKPVWSENGDRVESVNLIKKSKTDGSTEYYVQIKTKKDVTLDSNNINGKLELSTKTGKTISINNTNKANFNVFFTLGYPVKKAGGVNETTAIIPDSDNIFKFENKSTGTDNDKFAYDEEFEFSLYGLEDATFVVDTNGQGNILVSNTVKYNEGLEEIFGDDNYVYINGNGAMFNRTGVLTIPAEEGQFLYAVKENGKLAPVKGAKYDDVEEAFVIATRTLGKYVIADKEYETKVVTPEAPAVEAPVNPGTGAAA